MQLLIDTSDKDIFVGLIDGNQFVYFSRTQSALESLFREINNCLSSNNIDLSDLSGFLFCEGPGSNLGLQISAIALKIWGMLPNIKLKKIYSYNRLVLAKNVLQKFHLNNNLKNDHLKSYRNEIESKNDLKDSSFKIFFKQSKNRYFLLETIDLENFTMKKCDENEFSEIIISSEKSCEQIWTLNDLDLKETNRFHKFDDIWINYPKVILESSNEITFERLLENIEQPEYKKLD